MANRRNDGWIVHASYCSDQGILLRNFLGAHHQPYDVRGAAAAGIESGACFRPAATDPDSDLWRGVSFRSQIGATCPLIAGAAESCHEDCLGMDAVPGNA